MPIALLKEENLLCDLHVLHDFSMLNIRHNVCYRAWLALR